MVHRVRTRHPVRGVARKQAVEHVEATPRETLDGFELFPVRLAAGFEEPASRELAPPGDEIAELCAKTVCRSVLAVNTITVAEGATYETATCAKCVLSKTVL